MPNPGILTISIIFILVASAIYAIGAIVLFRATGKKSVLWCLIANWIFTLAAAGCLLTPFMVPFVFPRGLPLADFYIPFVWVAGVCWFVSVCLLGLAVAESGDFRKLKKKKQ